MDSSLTEALTKKQYIGVFLKMSGFSPAIGLVIVKEAGKSFCVNRRPQLKIHFMRGVFENMFFPKLFWVKVKKKLLKINLEPRLEMTPLCYLASLVIGKRRK